eukprot:TRINITY_DN26833_c0_g1_i1.p2 TRINITY_DN26833_c0_g1~~TRINITY_DN26833_c0_g1_i1.p2  ORF type:complete len:161 (-),score=19.91 TRINITY_DN26833_c0_g1_i1:140-622(-)
MRTVRDDSAFRFKLGIFFFGEVSEAPVLGDNDLLGTRELVSGSVKGFLGGIEGGFLASHRHDDVSDINSGDNTTRLSESSSHSGLQSIGSGTRQHLVDSDDVPRMGSHSKVKVFLLTSLRHTFVSTDSSSFKSFRGNLFLFQRDQVEAERKVISWGFLLS